MRQYPKISVIVPVYNAAKYLSQCIDSIIGKEYPDLELILVNDGSTDDSLKICTDYAARYPHKVRCVSQSNKGQIAARKTGLSAANGEWVTFVDADDWLDDNKEMFTELAELTSAETDIVSFGLIQERGKSIFQEMQYLPGEYDGETVAKTYARIHPFFRLYSTSSMYGNFIKKSHIDKIAVHVPAEIRWSEDVSCMMLAVHDAKKVGFTDKYYYHYRIHDDSFCRQHNKNLLESQRRFYLFLKEEFNKRNAWHKMKDIVTACVVRDLMLGDYRLLFESCRDFLYPFNAVKPGMRIALYGMGDIGREYWRVLQKSSQYNVILFADAGKQGTVVDGIKIVSPQELCARHGEYDKAVMTLQDGMLARTIGDDLAQRGLPRDKIAYINDDLITEDAVKKALRL